MKGNNSIEINEATMKAALQLYFDSTYREGLSPLVDSVSVESSGLGLQMFSVRVSERKAE